MKKQGWLWAVCLLFGAALWAQSGPDKVCEVNVVVPKSGGAAYEAARKKHNEFHKAEKDKVAIIVYAIAAGPSTGNYLTASCGQMWKDMDGLDAFNQRDEADRAKTIDTVSASSQSSYYIIRPDLSSAPEPPTPAKMITVVHYFLKPSLVPQFTDAAKRISAAITQSKYPAKPSRWYQLAVGGQGPHYVLVTDRGSWADMQGPDQSVSDMLKQVYGNDDKTLQNLRDAIDHTVSELLEYRADLSYMPGK